MRSATQRRVKKDMKERETQAIWLHDTICGLTMIAAGCRTRARTRAHARTILMTV